MYSTVSLLYIEFRQLYPSYGPCPKCSLPMSVPGRPTGRPQSLVMGSNFMENPMLVMGWWSPVWEWPAQQVYSKKISLEVEVEVSTLCRTGKKRIRWSAFCLSKILRWVNPPSRGETLPMFNMLPSTFLYTWNPARPGQSSSPPSQ